MNDNLEGVSQRSCSSTCCKEPGASRWPQPAGRVGSESIERISVSKRQHIQERMNVECLAQAAKPELTAAAMGAIAGKADPAEALRDCTPQDVAVARA